LQEYLDSVTAEVLKRQEKEFGIDENLNIDCQGQILEAVKMLQYASKGLYK
jgi:hypothetical protein